MWFMIVPPSRASIDMLGVDVDRGAKDTVYQGVGDVPFGHPELAGEDGRPDPDPVAQRLRFDRGLAPWSLFASGCALRFPRALVSCPALCDHGRESLIP